MISYTGTKLTGESRALMKLLQATGIMCMVSAAPALDKLPTLLSGQKAIAKYLRRS